MMIPTYTNKSSPIKTPPANDKPSTNINTSSRQQHTQGSLALDIFPSNRSDDSENNDPPFKTPRAVVWTVLVLYTVACGLYLVGQLTPMWGLGASIQITFTEDSNQAPTPYIQILRTVSNESLLFDQVLPRNGSRRRSHTRCNSILL